MLAPSNSKVADRLQQTKGISITILVTISIISSELLLIYIWAQADADIGDSNTIAANFSESMNFQLLPHADSL